VKWRSLVAGVAGVLLLGSVSVARADDSHKVFTGCVTDRTDTSVTLKTSGSESITIDTTWLKPDQLDTLTADCVTISTVVKDGKYIAESIEDDDSSNNQGGRHDKDKEEDDHDGGHNDD
jgi:hypothetical protein